MSNRKPMGVLKLIGGFLGLLLLTYAMLLAWALWDSRLHTYTIHSVSGALASDDTALRLARSALRLHGVDPADFTVGNYFEGVTVARNALDTNRVTTRWIPRSKDNPGFGVALEQHGSDVVCFIARGN